MSMTIRDRRRGFQLDQQIGTASKDLRSGRVFGQQSQRVPSIFGDEEFERPHWISPTTGQKRRTPNTMSRSVVGAMASLIYESRRAECCRP